MGLSIELIGFETIKLHRIRLSFLKKMTLRNILLSLIYPGIKANILGMICSDCLQNQEELTFLPLRSALLQD